MPILRKLLLGLALSSCLTSAAMAVDLTVGSSTEPAAIDPHFSRSGNSQQIAAQVFNRLVEPDENLQIQPGLAVSWTNLDELTWEVKLREGVTFHDGSPFTAEDVVFSLERADEIPNSPAPFTARCTTFSSVEFSAPNAMTSAIGHCSSGMSRLTFATIDAAGTVGFRAK